MAYPVVVTGPRVTLREFAPADHADLHAIYGDQKTTEHLSFEPRTPEQVTALLKNIEKAARAEPRLDYTLAIALNGTGELIGTGRLALGTPDQAGPNAGLRADSPAAQFGLAIYAPYWGRGYGHEVLDLLIDYAFTHLGVDEVWGARGPANMASAALMKSSGFTEKMIIPHHITKAGVARDSVVHVLYKDIEKQGVRA
jgi:RimJ/RimL family protein N-acetyltransferase